MLSPKKTKFRKQMKGRVRGATKGGADVHFGEYGLQAISSGRLTARNDATCKASRKDLDSNFSR
jgi:large subunit ribosomal protein L16